MVGEDHHLLIATAVTVEVVVEVEFLGGLTIVVCSPQSELCIIRIINLQAIKKCLQFFTLQFW